MIIHIQIYQDKHILYYNILQIQLKDQDKDIQLEDLRQQYYMWRYNNSDNKKNIKQSNQLKKISDKYSIDTKLQYQYIKVFNLKLIIYPYLLTYLFFYIKI